MLIHCGGRNPGTLAEVMPGQSIQDDRPVLGGAVDGSVPGGGDLGDQAVGVLRRQLP